MACGPNLTIQQKYLDPSENVYFPLFYLPTNIHTSCDQSAEMLIQSLCKSQ